MDPSSRTRDWAPSVLNLRGLWCIPIIDIGYRWHIAYWWVAIIIIIIIISMRIQNRPECPIPAAIKRNMSRSPCWKRADLQWNTRLYSTYVLALCLLLQLAHQSQSFCLRTQRLAVFIKIVQSEVVDVLRCTLCVYSVSRKKPSWVFLIFSQKRFGNFSPNFTCLLDVPICAGLPIFIQLPATLTKLCHIERDHQHI